MWNITKRLLCSTQVCDPNQEWMTYININGFLQWFLRHLFLFLKSYVLTIAIILKKGSKNSFNLTWRAYTNLHSSHALRKWPILTYLQTWLTCEISWVFTKMSQEVLRFAKALGAYLAAMRTFNRLGGQGRNFLQALGIKIILLHIVTHLMIFYYWSYST